MRFWLKSCFEIFFHKFTPHKGTSQMISSLYDVWTSDKMNFEQILLLWEVAVN